MTEDQDKTTNPGDELEALRRAVERLTDRVERIEERLATTSSPATGAGAAVRSVMVQTADRLRHAWTALLGGAGAPPGGPGHGAGGSASGVAHPAIGPVALAATALLALLAIRVAWEIIDEIVDQMRHVLRWLL
jgi:hypothetical protein